MIFIVWLSVDSKAYAVCYMRHCVELNRCAVVMEYNVIHYIFTCYFHTSCVGSTHTLDSAGFLPSVGSELHSKVLQPGRVSLGRKQRSSAVRQSAESSMTKVIRIKRLCPCWEFEWVIGRRYIVNVIQQNLLPTLVKTTNIASSLPKDPHETARRGFTAMCQSSVQAQRAQPCLNLVISEIQPRQLDNLTTSLDNPKGVDIKRGVKSHQMNPSIWSSVCRFFFRVSECCQYQQKICFYALHDQELTCTIWSCNALVR